MTDYADYGYRSAELTHALNYLLPEVLRLVEPRPGLRVLDIGCGNGALAGVLLKQGCTVTGIDPSQSGIDCARAEFPNGRFEVLDADEHLLTNLGEAPFDVVVSTEVVEHLYDPKSFARTSWVALRPGGIFICSTPYHGYLKNLAIAVSNHFDQHVNPLWFGGHVKFWSRNTLFTLLKQAGFEDLRFQGVGRVPYLWKSMLVTGRRP